jgi:murein DD-endopeptidase MepM/ murein hydrolase activator NlpD
LFLFLLAFYFIDSPHVKSLNAKNKEIKFQYRILNNKILALTQDLSQMQHHDNNLYRPFFEADPIPLSVRTAGYGGTKDYQEFNHFESRNIIVPTYRKLDIISKQLYVQSKSYDEVTKLIRNKNLMLSSIPAIQPVKKKDLTAFGPFGMRMHPILKIYRLHAGVDLCAPMNTPIYAAGDGSVVEAKYGRGGIGNYVVINHSYGFETLYGHLNKMFVKVGQKVKRGDLIALMGSTGISNVSHLHYEVHKNGQPVNPVNYYFDDLSDEDYERMIDVSTNEFNSAFD